MAITSSILNIGNSPSDAISSISNLSKTAASTANKVKSLLGKYSSPSEIRDLITNGFLAGNSRFSPRFFARAFDEPTYLTFRLEFIFEDDPIMAEYNTAYNNRGLVDANFTSALYGKMFDRMPEPFLQGSGIAQASAAKDSSFGRYYSTEEYLDRSLGDHGRASLLHNFKLALKDIQDNFPYYFKSIGGISSLTKIDTASGMRNKESYIDLTCYEGIDLKITQLMNQYRKICWDDVYQRWVLPDMMRYFGMRIYVSEIRMFHDYNTIESLTGEISKMFGHEIDDFSKPEKRDMTARGEEKLLNSLNNINSAVRTGTAISNAFLGTKSWISKAANYTAGTLGTIFDVATDLADIASDLMACSHVMNEIMPTICYECHMCEFDIEEMMQHINDLHSSNADTKSPEPKITIKIGKVYEKQSYLLNDGTVPYENTGRYRMTPNEFWKSFTDANATQNLEYDDLIAKRNDSLSGLQFLGNIFSDEIFDRQFKGTQSASGEGSGTSQNTLYNRIADYVNNLEHDMGDARACMINVRRLGSVSAPENMNPDALLINKVLQSEMSYNRETMPEQIAMMSLIGQTLNEFTYLARMGDGQDFLGGSDSVATHPDGYALDALNGEGEKIKKNIKETTLSRALQQDSAIKSSLKQSTQIKENSGTLPDSQANSGQIVEIGIDVPSFENGDDDGFRGTVKLAKNLYVEETEDESSIEAGNYVDNYNDVPQSLATNQTKAALESLQTFTEMLMGAAEKIYGSKDINDMEISDSLKAKLADNLFEDYVEKLALSTATDENSILHQLLINYRGLKEFSKYESTALNNEIKGFSKLN